MIAVGHLGTLPDLGAAADGTAGSRPGGPSAKGYCRQLPPNAVNMRKYLRWVCGIAIARRGSEGRMAMPSLRPLMCAGVVVGGLVVAGPVAGVAVADPAAPMMRASPTAVKPAKATTTARPDRGATPATTTVPAVSASGGHSVISLGGTRAREERTDDGEDTKSDRDRIDIRVPGGRSNLPIPQVRMSVGATEREADNCTGSCLASLRVGTPGVSASVSLYSGAREPEPEPPGPAFRGGPAEEDPVVDAGSGGEVGQFSAGAPEVLEVPMIVAAPPVVGMSPPPASYRVRRGPHRRRRGSSVSRPPCPRPASGGSMIGTPSAFRRTARYRGRASRAVPRRGWVCRPPRAPAGRAASGSAPCRGCSGCSS